MSNVLILDCTLRDGGYINNWEFGEDVIGEICTNLATAKIEIIEAGFLTNLTHTKNQSLFSNENEIKNIVKNKGGSKVALMIALGEKETDPTYLASSNETGIDIVRITFHNSDIEIQKAINYATILKNKGYEVCMQPIGTTTYTDLELLNLIQQINVLNPYAFYLVDTLGALYNEKLLHFVNLIDFNLNKNIKLGFHSHNNLQMSFSNAQQLIDYKTDRTIIIDSSLYGMGRGAGNLCTELIVRYLNENGLKKYNLVSILEAIDSIIYPISLKTPWGYNAHYYMSAIHNCHPNYSSYLMNLQTLTMNEVNLLLQNLPKENRHIYNKKAIEELYLNFQQSNTRKQELTEFKINSSNVLVLAPGYSLIKYKAEIKEYIKEHKPTIISINTYTNEYGEDYVFISNRKRLMALNYDKVMAKIIITSNLPKLTEKFIYTDYESLCDKEFEQPDNAGMMLLRLLSKLNVEKVILAGFDGFLSPEYKNYYSNQLLSHHAKQTAENKNIDIKKQIQKLQKEMNIEFLTPSLYQGNDNEK